MATATTDDSPVSAQAQDTPIMSKLLAGPSHRKRAYSSGISGVTDAYDIKEESGILMVPMDDGMEESTTQDESHNPKVKRSARKCKWCDNFSRGSTNLCARHGGGRRCHCGKLARGPSNLCMKHGGGRRCAIPNCSAASVYKSDYCRSHGGGKRCAVEGCVASVYSSLEQKCFKHGGGRRCHHEGCNKAPVGKTDHCIRHGGGKRCSVDDCMKGAVCEGLCVKHHQDAYKLEVKSESAEKSSSSDRSSSGSPSPSKFQVVHTNTIDIRESPSDVMGPEVESTTSSPDVEFPKL